MKDQPTSIVEDSICGSRAAVCADTGTTHSFAGEKLFHFLKKSGLILNNSTADMALADGHVQKAEILTTTVDIGVKGKVIPIELSHEECQWKPNSSWSRFSERNRSRSRSLEKTLVFLRNYSPTI
ncbi:hypothetical protein CEXT_400871 [Caerostris extrusa]|uniref:Uncharacterized protein n=1 Tax=Caerostris extrusa TaxID=172846 RepID=A0AAV4WMP9_CAEEX|nr:hypothetical protein CEXT_400871 [Caerostris extrusa]